jgi:transposase-like protein
MYINPFRSKRNILYFTQNILKEVINYYKETNSILKVSQKFKKSQSHIKKILTSNNIQTYNRFESTLIRKPKLSFIYKEKDNIIKKYKNNISLRAIADEYNVDISPIKTLIKKYSYLKVSSNYQKILTQYKEQIITLYKNKTSIKQIAKKFDVPDLSLARFLKHNNIYTPAYRSKPNNAIPVSDKERVYKLHYNDNLTLKNIGNLYNCSAPTVALFFDKHNIPRRSKTESVILTNQNEIIARKRLKNLHKIKNYVLPSNKVIKLKGYEPQFLDFVFNNNLLSENDINYSPKRVKYLQDNKIRYYYPDFYIPQYNLIVEIKSKYIAKLQTENNLNNKKQGVLNAGYNYCLIIDNDFSNFINLIK